MDDPHSLSSKYLKVKLHKPMNAIMIHGFYYKDLNDGSLPLPFVLLQDETDKEWLALIKE